MMPNLLKQHAGKILKMKIRTLTREPFHLRIVVGDISGEIIDIRFIGPFKIIRRFINIEILTAVDLLVIFRLSGEILGILELISKH